MRFSRRQSKARASFWKHYYRLSRDERRIARRKYAQFLQSPLAVNFKPVNEHKPRLFSARISESIRALAIVEGGCVYWEWIGKHDEYDRIVRARQ